MKFDEVLVHLGEFGTYQKRIYMLLCLPQLNSIIQLTLSVFLLGVPDYRCAIPGYDNDTYKIQSYYHQQLINSTIPPSSGNDKQYDNCHLYVGNYTFDEYHRPINASVSSCNSWVYDQTVFKETFVSKVNLVCDRTFLQTVAKSVFFGGVFTGALVFGILSDVIGRKKTLYLSFILLDGFSIALSWAETFPQYVILRFGVGAANAGMFMSCFVMGMELVGPRKRLWAGNLMGYSSSLGQLILAGLAYWLRDWKLIELSTSVPGIVYLSYWWLIPESPRWLLSQGRSEEAKRILRKAAEVNKAKLPEYVLDNIWTNSTTSSGKFWQLFTSKILFIRTFIILLDWLVVGMVYFGLSLNTGNYGGNYYVDFAISGVVEIPAQLLCLVLLDRIGRKRLYLSGMLVAGIGCLSTLIYVYHDGNDLQPLNLTLAMVAKLGVSMGFSVIYIYSSELFPTVVRNAGMGAGSCSARIGAIMAPYVVDLGGVAGGKFGRGLPLIIFGVLSTVSALISLLLPETLNKKLSETIEDGRNFGKSTHHEEDKNVLIQKGEDLNTNPSHPINRSGSTIQDYSEIRK